MPTSSCSVPNCGRLVAARGLCLPHYKRWRKTGDVQADRPLRRYDPGAKCSVPSCDRRAIRRGLCNTHDVRMQRHGDVMEGLPIGGHPKPERCSVRGCTRVPVGNGLCSAHYQRDRHTGDVREDKPIGVRRLGKPWVSQLGYVYQSVNGKKIPQHRIVMEQKLGRPLLKSESVHHINGIRDDNRPENLELWSKAQPSGQRVADKVAWAREILARYGDDY